MLTSSLSPGFLIASPSLRDPNFERALVLLVEHGAAGALGFIVNRPAEASYAGLLKELGVAHGDVPNGDRAVMLGGPVSRNTGWIVFDSDLEGTPSLAPTISGEVILEHGESVAVGERIRVSASRDMLTDIANGHGPARHLLVLGYAGWRAGQLDEEIRQGSWFHSDVDPGIVFDTSYEEQWTAAFARIGIHPARVARSSPSHPA